MSTGRWEHPTTTNPVLRFGNWLFARLGAAPFPALSYHSLAHEFDLLETALLSREAQQRGASAPVALTPRARGFSPRP